MRIETQIQMPEAVQMPERMGKMESIIIYDGKNMWMISPFMERRKLSYEEGKQYQRERNWWELMPEEAKIVGTERIGKRECYVVEIKEEIERPFTRVWVDKENLVFVKAESETAEGETIVWLLSDFRKIKGDFEIPYKTELYVDGKINSTSLIKSVEINKGLSADLFDPEKVKVKRLDMEIMKKTMKEGKSR